PNEDRFVVFNPLGFVRTDYADFPLTGGPYIVTDMTTGTQVPSQMVTISGTSYLRILASNVPSLGYRVYRYAAGTPPTLPAAATVTHNQIESTLYRVLIGSSGQITSAYDKQASTEMAGTGLNDFGSGSGCSSSAAENPGPVTVTFHCTTSGSPAR